MKERLLLLFLAAASAACSTAGGNLLSEDPQLRAAALEAAFAAGKREQAEMVGRLKRALSGNDPRRRAYAAAALEDIGPAAAGAAPELISVLKDANPLVSAGAARTLIKLTQTSPTLAAVLKRDDHYLKTKVIAILSAQGDAGALALAGNFSKGSRALALESGRALAQMGPAAEKAVPALARAASSPDAEVKAMALSTLAAIGRPAGLWLAAALRSDSPRSRAGAAALLAAMPAPPPETLEALVSCLEDLEAPVRENSARALAAFGAEVLGGLPAAQLPVLARAAAAGTRESAPALAALVRTGRAEGRWLAAALKDQDPAVREDAALALLLTIPPPPEAALPLLAALTDKELKVRRAAAAALGGYAAASPEALPAGTAEALAAALLDADQETRKLAALPLGALAASNAKALAALLSALSDTAPEVRIAAADALAAAGPKAARAEEPLWILFRYRDCRQKTAAARALAAVKPVLRRLPAVARALRLVCPAPEGSSPRPDPASLPGLAPKKARSGPAR